MTGYFVDTCVFFAYAYPHEDWNPKCTQFFNDVYERFTGLRVQSEIKRRLHKRKQLYIRLAAFLDRNGNPQDFMANIEMNKNDRLHFEQQIAILSGKPRADVLTYFRDKDRVTQKGISDAFQKIQRPLVRMHFDPACENIIQILIENQFDAQILVDALVWSEKKSSSAFVTLDWTDIIQNRVKIIKALCRHRMINSPEDFPLGIKHIAEIP